MKKVKKQIKKKELKWYVLLLLFFLLSSIWFLYNSYSIKALKNSNSFQNTIVLRKKCGARRPKPSFNFIMVKYNDENYRVYIGRQFCNELNIGDTLRLVYNPKNNKMYEINEDKKGIRGAWISFSFFAVTAFYISYVIVKYRLLES